MLDRNQLLKTLKEKGPLFGLGVLAGAVLVLVVTKRAEARGALKSAWETLVSRGNEK